MNIQTKLSVGDDIFWIENDKIYLDEVSAIDIHVAGGLLISYQTAQLHPPLAESKVFATYFDAETQLGVENMVLHYMGNERFDTVVANWALAKLPGVGKFSTGDKLIMIRARYADVKHLVVASPHIFEIMRVVR